MSFDIDMVIFSIFLIGNIWYGLYHCRGITNIREYAVGDRNFSTMTVIITIVASYIGGGFFSHNLIETYRDGLYYMIPAVFDSIGLTIVGYFVIPRMSEFLGDLSVAESMEKLFGRKARVVSALTGIIASVGILGIQFKVAAKILELMFGTSGFYSTIISAAIVIVYSAFGGIKAVTFTDIIQFFTFACIMPIIVMVVWQSFQGDKSILKVIEASNKFNYKEVFDLSNPKLHYALWLILFFVYPWFSPMMFQRITMSKNINQAANSFKIAGVVCLSVQLLIMLIGFLIFVENPGLEPNNLLKHVINTYTITGFKGIVAVCIMAMIMSTADSLINSAAIMFSHDLCKPLGFKWAQDEVKVSKIFTLISGVGALYFALKKASIFNIALFSYGFYISVLAPSLAYAIFGFRSSEKSVLIGMAAGFLAYLIWEYNFSHITIIESFVVGIIANTCFLFGSHYVLNQPGGWVGIKRPEIPRQMKDDRMRYWKKFKNQLTRFNFIEFCIMNRPINSSIYPFLGFFSVLSVFISIYVLPHDIYNQHKWLITFVYNVVLFISCYFLTYQIWPMAFRSSRFISIAWTLGSFYVLVCAPAIMTIITNFAHVQLMGLFISITVAAILFRWQMVILMLVSGFLLSFVFLRNFVDFYVSPDTVSMEFKLAYVLLLLSSSLIAFLKPMQQHADQVKRKVYDAEVEIRNLSEKVLGLLNMKQEFLNNINHEIRTPIHHIGFSAEAMNREFDNYTEDEKKEHVSIIYQGYKRIVEYIDDILDLSTLTSNKANLEYTLINFEELVHEVLDECRDMYLTSTEVQFVVKSDAENLMIYCDEDKIAQTIRHLIKNAIEYGSKRNIEINISNKLLNIGDRSVLGIQFTINDDGVGIPSNELHKIFGPFIQSSYTQKISGGRGLGLALAETIVRMHKGIIWAENNAHKSGATFSFIIPVYNDN
jgi:Na+/proline symporter/signal transduction histidine kinase